MRSGVIAKAPDRGDAEDNRSPRGMAPGDRTTPVLALTMALLLVAYAAQALAWVVAGRTNGDEGWYLYDATLAVRGALPYRDFAFTQTPLTLVVYGPWQLVHHSLLGGRVVSAVLALAGVGLCALAVRRRADGWAAIAFLVILLAFPIGLYNLVLVKTYALVLVLMAACLVALTSARPATFRFPVATACAVALVLTRTTGIFVLVPVVVLGLWTGDRRTRMRVVAVGAIGALVGLAFVLVDTRAAQYDLAGFHQELWFDVPLGERITTIVRLRLPDWLATYWPFVILGVVTVAAMAGTRRGRALCREQPAWPVVLVGLTGFLLSQLSAGQYAPVEYFAPVAPILVAIGVAVLWGTIGPQARPGRRGTAAVTAVAVLAFAGLCLVMPNTTDVTWQSYVAGRDGPQSVEWLNGVADEVGAVTAPGDEVLTLHLQAVVVAADRVAPAGITMGVFSYTDMPTDEARRLGWVNRDILVELIDGRGPAAVVFDDVDWAVLRWAGTISLQPADPQPVRAALGRNYRLVPSAAGVEIWVRR